MPGEVRAMRAGTDRESQLNTQWKGMKAATAFGYQVANFTCTQVTLPCWAEMTTRQQMNQTEHSGGEDDALHFNDKDLPALGSIPGTHADPSCFKKTVHVSQSGQVHMTSTCWMNQSWVLKKTSYSQSMYSSCLEINKEQLNAGWKPLPVLYHIHTHKKEKETNIVHSICVFYFLSCQ